MTRAGRLADQPWGRTLASFALERRTGELVVRADDGAMFRIAFSGGVVVAASSPLAVDSVARIAVTSHLVSASQVAAIVRRLAAERGRDEVDVVIEAARLKVDGAIRLRKRLLIQRTARTFAIDNGGYQFDDRITLPTQAGVDVDIAPALYHGIHINLADTRLFDDVRRLGERFALRPGADLGRFGFSGMEQPLLDSLRTGATLGELDARHRDIPPRTQHAVVYALVACGACAVVEESPGAAVIELDSRIRTSEWQRSPASRGSAPSIARTFTPRPETVRDLIASGIARLDAGADHYVLLGLPADASLETIRTGYFALAAQLEPARLPPLDPTTMRHAQRLFVAISGAFRVLSDPAQRAIYDRTPRVSAALVASAPKSESRAELADQAFQAGVRALRREDMDAAVDALARATTLAPNDVDYAAMLAWAKFCATRDKAGIAPDVRRALERAILRSRNPMMARFFLGRVERMLGRAAQALLHFREVLRLEPGHADAAAEIRLLEPQVAAARRR